MATKTITSYEHSCDLCGDTRDEGELVHLHDIPRGQNEMLQYRSRNAGPRVDICAECQKRPISDLISFCEGRVTISFCESRVIPARS